MKNARFFVFWNDTITKLTLHPGQVLRMYDKWQHEEGWSSIYAHYEYDGDTGVIRFISESDGVDCDGRLTNTAEFSCLVKSMQNKYNRHAKVWYPAWKEEKTIVNDHYARAMNY